MSSLHLTCRPPLPLGCPTSAGRRSETPLSASTTNRRDGQGNNGARPASQRALHPAASHYRRYAAGAGIGPARPPTCLLLVCSHCQSPRLLSSTVDWPTERFNPLVRGVAYLQSSLPSFPFSSSSAAGLADPRSPRPGPSDYQKLLASLPALLPTAVRQRFRCFPQSNDSPAKQISAGRSRPRPIPSSILVIPTLVGKPFQGSRLRADKVRQLATSAPDDSHTSPALTSSDGR